jgi:hypothetical protein
MEYGLSGSAAEAGSNVSGVCDSFSVVIIAHAEMNNKESPKEQKIRAMKVSYLLAIRLGRSKRYADWTRQKRTLKTGV